MKKLIKFIGLAIAVSFVVLVVLASIGPDTSIYTGNRLPSRFFTTIRSLNLLKEGEQIKFFYSDALFDIKTGLYFVTGSNLVLYSSEWDDPEIIIPIDQITSVDVEYDDSFLDDSWVHVTTDSGAEVAFPLSSEKGLDKRFVKAIKENVDDD
jgi:hypothetical protein